MLGPEEVVAKARRHLELHLWDVDAAGAWPHSVGLKLPQGMRLKADEAYADWAYEMRKWAPEHGLELVVAGRFAGPRGQDAPVGVVVPSEGEAAALAGMESEVALRDARVGALLGAGWTPEVACGVAKASRGYTDVDFALLVQAGLWFREHDARGLTPREVPLPGFHAKWLDATGRRALVARLAGKDSLGLAQRPLEVELKYLDPMYAGFGLAIVGRGVGSKEKSGAVCFDGTAPYAVQTVVIVENKDTFLSFPPLEGGVCVFGAGRAAIAALPGLSWIAKAPRICYWGDIDADGFEILADLRTAGLACTSLLMDEATWRTYAPFGTNRMPKGTPIATVADASPIEGLADNEQALYLGLKRGTLHPLRVEQERVSYDDLLHALEEAL